MNASLGIIPVIRMHTATILLVASTAHVILDFREMEHFAEVIQWYDRDSKAMKDLPFNVYTYANSRIQLRKTDESYNE